MLNQNEPTTVPAPDPAWLSLRVVDTRGEGVSGAEFRLTVLDKPGVIARSAEGVVRFCAAFTGVGYVQMLRPPFGYWPQEQIHTVFAPEKGTYYIGNKPSDAFAFVLIRTNAARPTEKIAPVYTNTRDLTERINEALREVVARRKAGP